MFLHSVTITHPHTWCSPLCRLSHRLSGCAGGTASVSPASSSLGTRGTSLTAQTSSAFPLVPGGWTCTEQNSKLPLEGKNTKDHKREAKKKKRGCWHKCMSIFRDRQYTPVAFSVTVSHQDMICRCFEFQVHLLDVGLFKRWTSQRSLYYWLAHLQDAFPQQLREMGWKKRTMLIVKWWHLTVLKNTKYKYKWTRV